MIQKQGDWVPKNVERRFFTSKMLKRKGLLQRLVTGDKNGSTAITLKKINCITRPSLNTDSQAKHSWKIPMLYIWWDQRDVLYYEFSNHF